MAKEMRKEIIELKEDVLKMAGLASNMLNDAVNALINTDIDLAESVKGNKEKLRKFDYEIEARALKTLTLYQPMAIDLRRIAAILKIITYLYRIGRYGKDIASVVKELTDTFTYSETTGIKHMWEHVSSLIEDAIESFDKAEITKIADFEERDDEVDQMRWSIFRETVSHMLEKPTHITHSAHFIMISRYLERCGDHACKIAEKVHYMVTGEHVEIS
ncbi:MAG: phosphate signaling complex protein PhoU [Candidatus Lokiarchaeota archaeon]|nr:phosphate signaling complex protein PhoU [Candidatus Lokiarchaeota archaeon]MBD3201225.1 phosphate signaling complex protein PhoU [Candidatus Lokiarchaeota archaeon]